MITMNSTIIINLNLYIIGYYANSIIMIITASGSASSHMLGLDDLPLALLVLRPEYVQQRDGVVQAAVPKPEPPDRLDQRVDLPGDRHIIRIHPHHKRAQRRLRQVGPRRPLCPPELKGRAQAHTKNLGWYV